jgi:sodium-dependent dicarboxylate transporter 2/3/5
VAALVGTGAVAFGPSPAGLSTAGQYAVATMTFAAVCWVTGALPLPVTALCVPVLLAGFGVFPSLSGAVAGFADPVVFLLLAGFMLAEALQIHDVDRRLAFALLVRLGTSPRRLVLAVMVATAGLSMVISNSATTAMMVPVALGVARQVVHGTAALPTEPDPSSYSNLEIATLLGTAYAASIGGVGTLVGTPPNAIVVGQLDERLGVTVGFVEWLAIGLPLVAVGLPLAWYVLLWLYPPEVEDVGDARAEARRTLEGFGPLDAAGRRTVYVTAATAVLWLVGGVGALFSGVLPEAWQVTLFGGTGGSVLGGPHQGLLYYVSVGLAAIPVLVAAGCVEWEELLDVDWGTLLLLGGGLSLANALSATDAVAWLADVTLGSLGGVPVVLVVLALVTVTVLLGELASNTAMAAIFAPLLITLGPEYAPALGTAPETAAVFLAVTGAVAASFGFALPVATPPNAIAFGTGHLTKDHMLRAGVVLDALMIVVATAMLLGLFVLVWPALF